MDKFLGWTILTGAFFLNTAKENNELSIISFTKILSTEKDGKKRNNFLT